MKALFSFLSCLIMLALFTRCADDELDGPSDGLPDKGLVVRLSTGGGLETKTPLNSTGAYHHVQEVWAVLYKLNASATDPTNNENYDFVTAENLDWNPLDDAFDAAEKRPIAPDRNDYTNDDAYNAAVAKYEAEYAKYLEAIQAAGGSYGNGNIQQKDFELEVDKDGMILPPATYRVLCIGLDDVSKTLYGLKEGDNLNTTIFATDKTLADAVATITDIKQAFEGELFAGWAEFQFEPDNLNIVEVEMKRRMAGVLCYVTDIPKVITADGEKLVKRIRLALYTGDNVSEDGSSKKGLNNQIHLCRLEGEERSQDFGTLTNDASWSAPDKDGYTTLAYYALPEQSSNNTDTYQFNWEAKDVSLKNNSLLMGAYVIPIKKGTEPTLVVQLIGGDNVSYAESDSPQEVENEQAENGELLATFNATRSGAEGGDASYDILPNYIYHIGNKPEPDGTDKDEPVSLLGQKITVTPMEWDKSYKIPVEYPSVSIESTLQLVEVSLGDGETEVSYDENGVPIGTIKYLTEGYEFDCIGIDDDNNEAYRDEYYMGAPYNKRLFLKVTKNVLGTGWKLLIDGNDVNDQYKRMLYFSSEQNDVFTYETSYPKEEDEYGDGSKDVYIPLLLTSYAENDETKTDRSVKITLTRSNNTTDVLTVTQKNALIITEGNIKRGFSHVDWDDGNDGVAFGFSSSSVYSVTGESYPWNNGQNILNNAKDHDDFKSSAIYYCARKFVTVSNEQKQWTKDWFLPARTELYYFMENFPDAVVMWDHYWTSSPYGQKRAHYNYIDGTGEPRYKLPSSGIWVDSPPDSEEGNRAKTKKMRAACTLPSESAYSGEEDRHNVETS